IYVRPDQVRDEVRAVIAIIEHFYGLFGLKPRYVLATKPKEALGTEKDWALAEEALADAMEKEKIPYETAKGEGAFYGPKIEVHMKDSQGRDWQLGTAQLDLVMLPKQFKLFYADAEGQKQAPWVIHRAIFGSFERFIGILLEHYAGALPFWLSPVQVAVLAINDKVLKYANTVRQKLGEKELRVWLDDRNESIGKKIREAEMQKIPYLLVIGDREADGGTVSVRERGKGDTGAISFEQFIAKVAQEKTP
ncbi:MAG: threonine--tRNA ligase, partial [Candidatus Sungiibacteriota bacterium]